MIKYFELRDSGTFMPIAAMKLMGLTDKETQLLARAGYGKDTNAHLGYTFLVLLNGPEIAYDPYAWGDRTVHTAHLYIHEHWDELESGQLIDVRVILGEATEPCESELE